MPLLSEGYGTVCESEERRSSPSHGAGRYRSARSARARGYDGGYDDTLVVPTGVELRRESPERETEIAITRSGRYQRG